MKGHHLRTPRRASGHGHCGHTGGLQGALGFVRSYYLLVCFTLYIYIYVYMYVCMYVCMYVWVSPSESCGELPAKFGALLCGLVL